MPEKRMIAVIGATGAQGGGLVRAILNDPDRRFDVRALTRYPSSDRARALAELGAHVLAADLDDESSIRRAFVGASAAFCVTFFWAHLSPEKEIEHAGVMARSAKRAGVPHVIWSTLEDTRHWIPLDDRRMPTLKGSYKVPHFDAKAEGNRVFVALGVPTTFLRTSFYWDNFISFGSFGLGPRRDSTGRLALAFPMGDSRLPGIAAEDIGKCAYAIFKRGSHFVGQTVGIAGEHLTGAEMAFSLTCALGEEVTYVDMPPADYRALDLPGAPELGNMFQFKRDFQDAFCGARDVAFSRALNPELQSFRMWLAEQKGRIPLD